ncbi:MAG TPA: IPT/TIG domain-containing protein [Vicinamibacteria bacterium]|nr:IPT/TIG domain-containing protein [Vicinamibacteria bacterium]
MDQPEPASVATLTVSGGLLDGTEYAIVDRGRPVLIGSSMDADVQIMLGNVEAAHACITCSPDGLVLSDVGSATGTFVNGDPVEGDRLLHDGDEISLGVPGAKGTAKMMLRLRAQPASPAPHDAVPALQDHGPAPALGQTPAPAFGGSVPATGLALVEEAGGPSPTGLAPFEPQGKPAPTGLAPFEAPRKLEPTSLAPAEPPERAAAVPSEPKPVIEGTLPLPRPGATPPRPAPPKPAVPPHGATPPPPRPLVSPPPPAQPAAPPAPPPRPSPPAPPRKPDYSALPSIPPAAKADEEGLLLAEPESPAAAPFPPLRAPSRPSDGRRPTVRRRGMRLPSLPLLPMLGAVGAIAVAAAGLWTWRTVASPRPPELLSIAPTQAQVGQTLTLSGRNFARTPAGNTVLFGAARGAVSAASGTELKVEVPPGAKSTVPVVVETGGGRSRPLTVTVEALAKPTALDPEVALPGQRILVRVEGLEGQKVSVDVGGLPSPAVEATAEGVRAVVPDVGLPEGASTKVVVQAGTAPARSFDLLIGRLPLVLSLKPQTGPVGELVTVEGRGFDPSPAMDAVTFAGEPAFVVAADRTELKVVAPAALATGEPELPVVVKTGGRTSTARVAFRLMRSATSAFRPRFFPAPVPEYPGEPLAFVSTEIGPLLLLGSPGGSASVGERALAVAAALNNIVDRAAAPPAFEFRPAPQPCVGVVGTPAPLLCATPPDLAAYSKPWDGGRAVRRVSPAALGRHWAALLQDYLGLFLFRQRPLQLLAVSPRGSVFGDIYREANRSTPGETTVPSRLVAPPPPGWAAALRQAALVVTEESAHSAAVVEGNWQGQIDDPDQGPRSFRVQLRSETGHLAGTLTTSAGSLEVRAPLREVEFAGGSLRFTADLQGAACRFRGTLEGDRLAGTIERPNNRPPLRFTMRFLE